MRRMSLLIVLGVLATPALAKDMLFWNTTSKEFTQVFLAPAGTTKWGANQTDNDSDHTVGADERLKITGVAPGRYDVKLVDAKGRICIVRDVEAKAAGKVAFSISEPQLAGCSP